MDALRHLKHGIACMSQLKKRSPRTSFGRVRAKKLKLPDLHLTTEQATAPIESDDDDECDVNEYPLPPYPEAPKPKKRHKKTSNTTEVTESTTGSESEQPAPPTKPLTAKERRGAHSQYEAFKRKKRKMHLEDVGTEEVISDNRPHFYEALERESAKIYSGPGTQGSLL